MAGIACYGGIGVVDCIWLIGEKKLHSLKHLKSRICLPFFVADDHVLEGDGLPLLTFPDEGDFVTLSSVSGWITKEFEIALF